MLRWLRPEPPTRLSSPFSMNSMKGRSLPGTEARLPDELREQQKRIRSTPQGPSPFLPPSPRAVQ